MLRSFNSHSWRFKWAIATATYKTNVVKKSQNTKCIQSYKIRTLSNRGKMIYHTRKRLPAKSVGLEKKVGAKQVDPRFCSATQEWCRLLESSHHYKVANNTVKQWRSLYHLMPTILLERFYSSSFNEYNNIQPMFLSHLTFLP